MKKLTPESIESITASVPTLPATVQASAITLESLRASAQTLAVGRDTTNTTELTAIAKAMNSKDKLKPEYGAGLASLPHGSWATVKGGAKRNVATAYTVEALLASK